MVYIVYIHIPYVWFYIDMHIIILVDAISHIISFDSLRVEIEYEKLLPLLPALKLPGFGLM